MYWLQETLQNPRRQLGLDSESLYPQIESYVDLAEVVNHKVIVLVFEVYHPPIQWWTHLRLSFHAWLEYVEVYHLLT
jgi:hypothetical protein